MNPHHVITNIICRNELIADAHNCMEHREHDTMYKTLSECFYWPNIYDDIAWFVCSCTVCQLCSKAKPIMPFSPTWTFAVLRRFNLDTVDMPDGKGRYKFLYQVWNLLLNGWKFMQNGSTIQNSGPSSSMKILSASLVAYHSFESIMVLSSRVLLRSSSSNMASLPSFLRLTILKAMVLWNVLIKLLQSRSSMHAGRTAIFGHCSFMLDYLPSDVL